MNLRQADIKLQYAIQAAADKDLEPGDQVIVFQEKQVNYSIGE